MRRRQAGIKGLQKRQQQREKFAEVGSDIADMQITQISDQMKEFRTNLEDFARKYRSDIKKDPLFRQRFQTMCTRIGVDPLASNKGFWGELLGVGDFYYELGVQIVEICLQTRGTNGGLLEIHELLAALVRKRGVKSTQQEPISVDDVERAIQKLKILGTGFDLIRLRGGGGKGRSGGGEEKVMVQSVPVELSMDHTTVLIIAEMQNGCVTRAVLRREGGGGSGYWSEERCERVLSELLKEGMCWVDSQYSGGEGEGGGDTVAYWFPSLCDFI
eukprot:Nk52_evm70s151 gene=Nk52_evmTU70s151